LCKHYAYTLFKLLLNAPAFFKIKNKIQSCCRWVLEKR